MLDLDCTILTHVVNSAKRDAANHPRWLHAIDRAVTELARNPYLERQDGRLLIGSTSGQVYAANGACQCAAYANGQPCWHRAASRLVRRHDAVHTETRVRVLPSYRQALAEMNELFA